MTLVVSGFMIGAHLYIGWRMKKGFNAAFDHSSAAWIPLLLLSSFYIFPVTGVGIYALVGQLDLLELPKTITYWFWFGVVFSFQTITWLVILDLGMVIASFSGKWEYRLVNRWYGFAVVSLVAFMMIFSGIKLYRDSTQIKIDRIELAVNNLPDSMNGFKIVHISDIQADRYTGQEEIRRYVEKINEQKADLIVFTGDLISYGTDYIKMAARELSKAEASYGTFAVVGDHDFWAGLSHIRPALEERGIGLLQNESQLVPIRGDTLLVTGITHVYSKKASADKVNSLASDPVEAAFKIMASHQISSLLRSQAEENKYHLLLSGHTHGGQIRLSFFGIGFSASSMETEFISGGYREGNLFINVNNGLGFTLGPVRYNAPPSISVIKLVKP